MNNALTVSGLTKTYKDFVWTMFLLAFQVGLLSG